MTSATAPTEDAEIRIVKSLPNWTRCERPGQRFLGSVLLPNEKDDPTVYDVYVYGKHADAIGLRFGHHPRDEHTHTAQYWNRLKTPLAQGLKKALQQWVRKWDGS